MRCSKWLRRGESKPKLFVYAPRVCDTPSRLLLLPIRQPDEMLAHHICFWVVRAVFSNRPGHPSRWKLAVAWLCRPLPSFACTAAAFAFTPFLGDDFVQVRRPISRLCLFYACALSFTSRGWWTIFSSILSFTDLFTNTFPNIKIHTLWFGSHGAPSPGNNRSEPWVCLRFCHERGVAHNRSEPWVCLRFCHERGVALLAVSTATRFA